MPPINSQPITFPAALDDGGARLARAVLAEEIALARSCGFALRDLEITLHPSGLFTLDIASHALH